MVKTLKCHFTVEICDSGQVTKTRDQRVTMLPAHKLHVKRIIWCGDIANKCFSIGWPSTSLNL